MSEEIVSRPPRRPPGRPPKKRPISTRRRERVPLGAYRSKLAIPEGVIPPDKVARIVNDVPGRLQQAINGGYEFVEDEHLKTGEGTENTRDEMNSKVRFIVGQTDGGEPLYGYLMVIDRDWYEEDQKEKQKQVDEIDRAIHGGTIAEQPGDMRYNAGIKYETTKT